MNVPELFDVGAVSVNGASPNCFVAIEKLVIVGVALLTVNVAVMVPELYVEVAACDAVMTVEPIDRMVTVFPAMVATEVLALV